MSPDASTFDRLLAYDHKTANILEPITNSANV